MAKTVKEHTDETDQIVRHLKDGDALVAKLRDELDTTRSALDWLKQFKHPAFTGDVQYKGFRPAKDDKHATMGAVIDARIGAINALLGDRA